MIKDVFKLRKSAWYTKMVEWMWGLQYSDFSHMCPFFWLCLFSVLIFVPYFVVRAIIVLFKVFFEEVRDNIDKLKIVRREKRDQNWKVEITKRDVAAKRILSDKDLIKDFAEKLYYYWFEDKCLPVFYEGLLDRFPIADQTSIEEMVGELKNQRAEIVAENKRLKEERERRKWEAVKARKQRINNILRYAKPIGKAFLWIAAGLSALIVLWLAYKGIVLLTYVPSKIWVRAGLVFGAIIVLILIILGLTKVKWPVVDINYSIFNISCEWEKRWGTFFTFIWKYILYPFWWLIKGIGKIFQALFMAAKDECPAVEWED